jgi:hypothetical protein
VKRSLYKLFALFVMSFALAILTLDHNVTATDNCRADYETCVGSCSGNADCERGCFSSFSQCEEAIFTDMEQTVLDYFGENGQPLPDLGSYRACMRSCPNCTIPFPDGPDEDDVSCVEAKVACKIDCLAMIQ